MNPNSTNRSSSFQVFTQYSGFPIESITTSLTVVMDQLALFSRIQLSLADPVLNGETKEYSFFITPKIAINVNDTIEINVVNDINVVYPLKFTNGIQSCDISSGSSSFTN
jgi:hypothetical protein